MIFFFLNSSLGHCRQVMPGSGVLGSTYDTVVVKILVPCTTFFFKDSNIQEEKQLNHFFPQLTFGSVLNACL